MKANIGKKGLSDILSGFYEKPIKDIAFDLDTTTRGNSQRDSEEVPVFKECLVDFGDTTFAKIDEQGLKKMISVSFGNKGGHVNPDEDIHFNLGLKYTGDTTLTRKAVPEFRGVLVDYQEIKADTAADEDKQYTSLAEMRRDECYKSLMEMPDRDMLESIQAHFASHPTRPGEKDLKERAAYELCQLDANEKELPFTDGRIYSDVKESLARQFADTRIREFSINMAGIRPEDLNLKSVGEYQRNESMPWDKSTVHVYRVPAELYKDKFDDVNVSMERGDGKYENAFVPDKYYTNNPMNVKSCRAEVEITDWSNGKLKPQSAVAKVVVDTDLMSGDVVELDDDMLKGLDQITALEQ